ncbi:FIG00993130: hypothetical protein [hydrothermal vent metagenome]|uniref:PAS domain-containing protein n=1 Tax=hydrothermal vent metagenome TaxID=652676 RepID=A0A3B0SXX8_9ZZZZ
MQEEMMSEKVSRLKKSKSRDRNIAAFYDYWQSMRHGTDVPRRSEIDPRGIETLLANAFIAEKIAPGLARMRIAGTHLSDLLGMEVRGMPISAFMTPAHRDELAGLLVDVFERPAMLQIELVSPGHMGKPALTGTLVMLPLRSDLGDISRALGCLITKGPIGRTPRRFEIAAHKITPLDLSPVSGLMQTAGIAQPAGMAEEARPFNGTAPLTGSERPYLRLVK